MKNEDKHGILKKENTASHILTIKEEQSVDICGRSTKRDSDVPLQGENVPLFLSGERQ